MIYTILIVDDNKDVRARYSDVFKNNGFAILEAEDGEAGFNVAAEKKPDMVFTGIIMPKMNGFDLVERLRKNPETASIPVMICSHLGRREDKLKAQEMGIKDFIAMDFVPPIEVVRRARLLIEGEGTKEYFLDINETAMDAAKLTRDFNLPPYFQCEKHTGEKLRLVLSAEPENPKEFKAKFICPKD